MVLVKEVENIQVVVASSATLEGDGEKATFERLECVMHFMLKCGACILVWRRLG
jgi:hypothetical protein